MFYTEVFWDWDRLGGFILLAAIRSFLCLYPSNHHYSTPKLQKGNPLWEALLPSLLMKCCHSRFSSAPLLSTCLTYFYLNRWFPVVISTSCQSHRFASLQVREQCNDFRSWQWYFSHLKSIKKNAWTCVFPLQAVQDSSYLNICLFIKYIIWAKLI